MKDLSFFLLKNSLGAKMRKSFKSFCNGDGSTSTLNQRKTGTQEISQSFVGSSFLDNGALQQSPPTLEEMILQLELEEKMAARKAKLDEYGEMRRRMSCVNNADILRSARNALNQYPRFSLDGKDAMYQSSFRNLPPINTGGRKSICCEYGLRKGMYKDGFNSKEEQVPCLPKKLAGERVVWCKPGVVAKLMGLEAMPVSIDSKRSKERFMSSVIRKQNLKRRTEKNDKERRRIVMDLNGCGERKRGIRASCSNTEYCVMKPVAVETTKDEAGWPIRRFL